MTMTRKAIDELKQLRGSQVEIFGQPVTLPNTIGDLEIDTINILEDVGKSPTLKSKSETAKGG